MQPGTPLLLWALFAVSVIWAQAQKGEPVLIGDFEIFSCSEFRGLADHFMAELANDPNSLGYVVNSGPFEKLSTIVWREELIKAQMEFRNFDSSRVVFDRSDSAGTIRTRFWKMHSSKARPNIQNVDNSLSLSARIKPFLLIEQTFYNDSECPDANYPLLFARFLDANPNARGNLVVYGTTSREIRRRENMALSQLVSTFKISRKRIKTFHRLVRNDPERPKGIEYWCLP